VDVTCGLEVTGPSHRLPPDFALQREGSHEIVVCGRPVRVAPVEETIARAVVLNDGARLMAIAITPDGAIAASLKPSGSHAEGLALLKMIISLYEGGVGEIAISQETTEPGPE
jgi:hypothetical protein